jgi:threonine aldolase
MASMSTDVIDLRSDTVTRPTAAMRAAMAAAEVGDDVFGDDPTVNRLQAAMAERLGFEAGLFLPTATQSNLVALMTHCQRGDEYIAGQQAHCYKYEAGGGAVLGSIQPQPVEHADDGSLRLDHVAAAIKADDFHYARTRLLALENTIGGRAVPLTSMRALTDFAHGKGLATHLDGARLFNAATALGVPAAEVARGFDSVTVCLSKGLGCPAGAVLVGTRDFIERARRPRKMLGGGMRQAGILAAAGLHALDHHVARLADDHALATQAGRWLARHRRHRGQRSAHQHGVPADGPGPARRDRARVRAAGHPAARLRRADASGHAPGCRCAGIERVIGAFKRYFGG